MKTKKIISRIFLIVALLFLLLGSRSQVLTPAAPVVKHETANLGQVKILENYYQLPMSFEANQGQAENQVKYLSHGQGYELVLTGNGAQISLKKPDFRVLKASAGLLAKFLDTADSLIAQTSLGIQLVGSNPQPQVIALNELPGKVNYYFGNDPAKWQTNIPTYARIMYQEVYPGIDMVYYGDQKQLEYDFTITPGADPKNIILGLNGISIITLDTQGDIVIPTSTGQIRMHKPFIYQEIDGSRNIIPGGYTIRGNNQIAFEVGTYDTTKELVIDPVLEYSTYFGGSGDEIGYGITVDSQGAVYIMGLTSSIELLGDELNNNNMQVYVAKLNPTGSDFEYKTYFGGSGEQNMATLISGGISVDAAFNVFVSGSTSSPDFPVIGTVLNTLNGLIDAFVVKLNPVGEIDFARYLGGSGKDDAGRIAVDSEGNIYTTGHTNSTDFPITPNAIQATYRGDNNTGPDLFNFFGDGFVVKLDNAGGILYSTYLGGSNDDTGIGIATDASQNIYVTGLTSSPDFLPLENAFQDHFAGPDDATNMPFLSDAFVTKFNSDFSIAYSTYLGGTGDDIGIGIAVDQFGNTYVTGSASENFRITTGAMQSIFGGEIVNGFGLGDAFIAKVDQSGNLVYSTYLGGTESDIGTGIDVDSQGNAYVTGLTFSNNFPIANSLQLGITDQYISAFITSLTADGQALIYSTYLKSILFGGGGDIAVDASGNVYVTGFTDGAFPTVNPIQGAISGSLDAFVAKLSPAFQTPTGESITVLPLDDSTGKTPLTLTFETVTEPGTTNLATSISGPDPTSNFSFGETPTYYDISTTAVYAPDSLIQVCISYDPAQFQSSNLANLVLLHYEDDAWVDITTSNDMENYILCGTVGSLSPFVAAEPVTPATLPTITYQNRTEPNSEGWNNTDVTVNWSCTNSLSSNVSVLVDEEGFNKSATGTCTDQAGNSVSDTQTGINIDKTLPSLIPVINPNPIILNGSATITPGAADELSGIASQSCSPLDTSTVGAKTIDCTATDKAGNTAYQTATYRVIYRFDGFLQPINDTAHQICSGCPVSIFKGNSTVPVKFQLKDANGNLVQAVNILQWLAPQKGSPTSSPVDESIYVVAATNGNTYLWDGDTYHYNWNTKGFSISYYWRIGVKLDDGQTYTVTIGLR